MRHSDNICSLINEPIPKKKTNILLKPRPPSAKKIRAVFSLIGTASVINFFYPCKNTFFCSFLQIFFFLTGFIIEPVYLYIF